MKKFLICFTAITFILTINCFAQENSGFTPEILDSVREHHPDFEPSVYQRDVRLQRAPEYDDETQKELQTFELSCRQETCDDCVDGFKQMYIARHTKKGKPEPKCVECITNADCIDGVLCQPVTQACSSCTNPMTCPESNIGPMYYVMQALKEYFEYNERFPLSLGDLTVSTPAFLLEENLDVPGYDFTYKPDGYKFELHFSTKSGFGYQYYTDESFIIRYKKHEPSGKDGTAIEL